MLTHDQHAVSAPSAEVQVSTSAGEPTSFYRHCEAVAQRRSFDAVTYMESLGIDSEIPYDNVARDYSRATVVPTSTKFRG